MIPEHNMLPILSTHLRRKQQKAEDLSDTCNIYAQLLSVLQEANTEGVVAREHGTERYYPSRMSIANTATPDRVAMLPDFVPVVTRRRTLRVDRLVRGIVGAATFRRVWTAGVERTATRRINC